MKIYDIPHQLARLWAEIDSAFEGGDVLTHDGRVLTGDDAADYFECRLRELEQSRDVTALDIACGIVAAEAEAEAVDRQRLKLANRKKALENKAERGKRFLSSIIPRGKKLKDGRVNVSWRKSSSVEVTIDPEHLPFEYKREIKRVEPDRAAMTKDLKRGIAIPGCKLVEKDNIQIK